MSKANGDLLPIPWPAVAVSVVLGAACLAMGFYWGAAFFLGIVALLLGLALAVHQGWIPGPLERAGQLARKERVPRASAPVHHKGPLPDLSASRQADVRRVVRVMAQHGVFAPETPDPALFYPGVAEMDWSVKPDTILPALWELDYYHPGTRPKRFMANLVMLDSKTEQEPVYLRKQVEDLARILGITISELIIEADWPPDNGPVPVRIGMQAGGSPLTIEYAGAVKYASTYIAHAIDARAGEVGIDRRLGWLWTDQGAWISALPDGAVEAMNGALKLTPQSRCCWEWIADAQPFAAGDTP